MYLARYRDDQHEIVQAIARFDAVVFEPVTLTTGWWAHHHRVARQLLAAQHVDFAVRIAANEGRLERTVVILAPQIREDEAELLRTSFFSLNTSIEESVAVPTDRREHDAMATAFPSLRWRLRPDVYPYHGYDVINDVRLFTALPDLLHAAMAHRWRLAYQINVRREPPRLDDRRWLRKNLLRVEEDRSLPEPLIALQRRVVETVERATFLVEEFIGVETAVARARVFEITEEAFGTRLRGLGLPAPDFEAEQNGEFEDLIASGVHSSASRELSAAERVVAAATGDELTSVLEWRPPETWVALIDNSARSAGGHVDHLKRIETRLARIERSLERQRPPSRECAELKEAVEISRTYPRSALAKARLIVEGIVQAIYLARKPGQRIKPLFNMIEELTETAGIFPRKIASYLHTLRVLGNLAAHAGEAEQSPPSDVDVELALLMVLELVAWYVLEFTAGTPSR